MKIKKLYEWVNDSESASYEFEDLEGDITLFRLTSHSVVDLSEPGEFYVCDENDIDPDILDNKSNDLYLITVTTNSDNIDEEKSRSECDEKNNMFIVAVKDDSKCRLVSAAPFNR